MKKKFTFFQSVNFKIALSFILLLLIAIQIIGGYFIRELEATTISDFKKNMDSQVVQLSNTLSTQMSNKDLERSDVDANLKKRYLIFQMQTFLKRELSMIKGLFGQPMI